LFDDADITWWQLARMWIDLSVQKRILITISSGKQE
jgi:hypothetical protein